VNIRVCLPLMSMILELGEPEQQEILELGEPEQQDCENFSFVCDQ